MVEAPTVTFDLQQLVTLGLLVNEMVMNSVKHAFADRERGTICVTLAQDQLTHYTLTVKDDGCGLPVGVELANGSSLGFRIMNSLAAQLRGEMAWLDEEGTIARVVFPVAPSIVRKDWDGQAN
jgi:two-component sensor histidine kinase